MKPELQSKLVEILSEIQDATKAGTNWTLEQLPDVVYQYILFYRVYTIIDFLLGVAGALAGIYGIRMSVKEFNKNGYESNDFIVVGGAMGGIVAAGVGISIGIASIKPMVMVWTAPKVFIIQEIARLLK